MLRQLLPEGASGDSGLLTRGRVATSICRLGDLEILHRWWSTCISSCGYAGKAQLLPEGSWRCLRELLFYIWQNGAKMVQNDRETLKRKQNRMVNGTFELNRLLVQTDLLCGWWQDGVSLVGSVGYKRVQKGRFTSDLFFLFLLISLLSPPPSSSSFPLTPLPPRAPPLYRSWICVHF